MTPNKQRPNSNGGEENSSSEDTKTDSDSPLRSKQDPPTQNPNKPEPKFKPNLSEAESSLKTHREAKTPLKLQETPQSNQNPSQEANLSPQEARAQAKTQNSLPTGTNNTGENEGRILQIRDSNNEFVNNGLEEMLSRKENIQPNGSGNLEARKEEPRRLSSGNPILDRMQRTVDSQPNQPSNPAILPSKEAHQNSSNQGKYAWDPQLAKTAIGKSFFLVVQYLIQIHLFLVFCDSPIKITHRQCSVETDSNLNMYWQIQTLQDQLETTYVLSQSFLLSEIVEYINCKHLLDNKSKSAIVVYLLYHRIFDFFPMDFRYRA